MREVAVAEERALVAGELRGYRQFLLLDDGLHPLVHRAGGPWGGGLEHAVCAAGREHSAPARDCRCGLYAWYLPGSATVCLGAVNAVIMAQGRCVLGDRGFRAASARIEAVALPPSLRWQPRAPARARRLLAERYPHTLVYASTRRMLRAHPPHRVDGLGVAPHRDASRGYRCALALLCAVFALACGALALLPRDAVAGAAGRWWPLLVLLFLAWQGGVVWLVTRLMASQAPHVELPPDRR